MRTPTWLALGALVVGCSADPTTSSATPTDIVDTETDDPPELCDIQAVFVRNDCTSCHDTTPGITGGGLDLLSDGVEDRLVGTASNHPSCTQDLLVDPFNPDHSILLRSVDGDRFPDPDESSCNPAPMPLGSATRMPSEDVDCLADWAWSQQPDTDEPVPAPFDPVPIEQAVAKAKYLLNGGAVTDADIDAVTADDGSLDLEAFRALADTWMWAEPMVLEPQFERKLKMFLELSLHQNGTGGSPNFQFQSQLWMKPKNNVDFIDQQAFVDTIRPLFVNVARDIVTEQQDFREVVTTRRWRVTTAILAALVYADNPENTGKPGPDARFAAFEHLTPDDYTDWRYVNFEQATPAAPPDFEYENTLFLRNALKVVAAEDSVRLWAPRVGFFNTIVFFDEFETNDDNDFRITTSQALIGALDAIFETGDLTPPATLDGLDEEHANESGSCYNCHALLDPMRSTFSSHYQINNRSAGERLTEPSTFAFHGHVVPFTYTMDDFADALVSHPRFATAWTQKVCMWANSQRCDESDPEFARIADTFRDGYSSGSDDDYRLDILFRELLTSTLVTGATPSPQHDRTEFIVSATRYGHACEAINARARQATKHRCTEQGLDASSCTAPALENCFGGLADAKSLGADAYVRGLRTYVTASTPDPVWSLAIRETCRDIDGGMVGDTRAFPPNDDPSSNIRRMVEVFMGLPPSNPTHDVAHDTLLRAYQIMRQGGECPAGTTPMQANVGIPLDGEYVCGSGLSKSRALKNALSIACSSPSFSGIGL